MSKRPDHVVASLDEATVADWLVAHPEFFVRHEAVLEAMRIPHTASGAVSLVERQIRVLREKNRGLERQLKEQARMARSNETVLERLHSLILKLITSRSVDDTLRVLEQGLRDDFHADYVVLRLFGSWARPEVTDPAAPGFAVAIAGRRPVCGQLKPETKSLLFADAADQVASAVLLPLCEEEDAACLGLLGIGSVDPKRFHPEMGTVFVAHLAAVTARILRLHLERGNA